MSGDPPADFDVIDKGGVRRIGELERRAPDVEDRHAPAFGAERRLLAQAENIAVEGERFVVVLGSYDEAQFTSRHGPGNAEGERFISGLGRCRQPLASGRPESQAEHPPFFGDRPNRP